MKLTHVLLIVLGLILASCNTTPNPIINPTLPTIDARGFWEFRTVNSLDGGQFKIEISNTLKVYRFTLLGGDGASAGFEVSGATTDPTVPIGAARQIDRFVQFLSDAKTHQIISDTFYENTTNPSVGFAMDASLSPSGNCKLFRARNATSPIAQACFSSALGLYGPVANLAVSPLP